MINIPILKSRKIFEHMTAYADMACSTIPAKHRRKRVDAATAAYRDYIKTHFDSIKAESIGAIKSPGYYLIPDEIFNLKRDLVGKKVDVMYTHNVNFGTKKYADVRVCVDTTGPMIVANITDQSLMLKADFPGARSYRYPIDHIMLIAYLGKEE